MRLRKHVHARAMDIYCGAHSGVPLCCIAWFITVWHYIILRGTFEPNRVHGAYFKLLDRRGSWGYVPCPLCLLLKRNQFQLKECRCDNRRSVYEHWSNLIDNPDMQVGQRTWSGDDTASPMG